MLTDSERQAERFECNVRRRAFLGISFCGSPRKTELGMEQLGTLNFCFEV